MLLRRQPTVIRLTPEDVLEYDDSIQEGATTHGAAAGQASDAHAGSPDSSVVVSDETGATGFGGMLLANKDKEQERNHRIGLHSQ